MKDVQDISASAAPLLDPGIEECWIDLDGPRMRYLRAGSGRPLILLHGLFAYSFSWRYTLPALAPYAALYAPDMLGAGFSDRPRGLDHSMRGTARRVLRFADKLGLSSFDLLGTSRGGAVAMAVAAECVAADHCRLKKLVLVCPVNPYSPHGKLLAPFFATSFGGTGFRWATEHIPSLFPFFHGRLYADRSKIPVGSLEGYKAPQAIPGWVEHGLSIVQTWRSDLKELEALLPKLRDIPTLLMWGEEDPAVYVSSMSELARYFSNVQTVVFPGIGHLPYEECPDEFNRDLIRFLKQG